MSVFEQHIFSLLSKSKDGYALFDKSDVLVFANSAFHDLMYTHEDDIGTLNFEQIMRRNFDNNRGVNINSGDIDRFIEYVHSVRRSVPQRLFEVDYVDQRWMMFSEQVGEHGELLMRMTDITKRKVIEFDLMSRLSKFQKMALTDELTGLANRRAFKESLNCEVSRLRRNNQCATLMVLDLDHFKRVNDLHGHTTGDLALSHSAKLMRSCIRPSDIIGRIGGEEFAIFLSDTDTQQAKVVAERVRESVACAPLVSDDYEISLTVSIGIATMCEDISFDTLYETADQALYQAKTMGRNCIHIYQ